MKESVVIEEKIIGKNWRIVIWLVIFLLGSVVVVSSKAALVGAMPTVVENHNEGVTLLDSTAERVSGEIILPVVEQTKVEIDGEEYVELEMAGYVKAGQVGYPELPQKGFFVAVPPGAEARLTVLEADSVLWEHVLVAARGQMALVGYDGGVPQGVPAFTPIRLPDPVAYSQNSLYPAAPMALENETWLRDQRVVQLMVYPVQVNSAQATVTVYHRLRFQIDFVYPDGEMPALSAPRPESSDYEQILAHTLLNYQQAQTWRQPQPIPPAINDGASLCLGNNAFRLTITQTGIYKVTHAALVAAGLTGSVSANSLRMCHLDQEIAIKVSDNDNDQLFENGDSILFYGETIKTHETTTNVYWLTYAGNAGQRITTSNGNPNGSTVPNNYNLPLHLEEDREYYSLYPLADSNDHWYWARDLNPIFPDRSTLDISFTLDNLASGQYSVPVEVEVWGFLASEQHTYRVLINGFQVGSLTEFFGSGKTVSNLFNGVVDSELLENGENTLTIESLANDNPNDPYHSILVNWVKITPKRLFVAQNNRLAFSQETPGSWQFPITGFSTTAIIWNVTNPYQPVEISTTNAGPGTVTFAQTITAAADYAVSGTSAYLTPVTITKDTVSNLRGTNQQADYIIITDPLFAGSLQPLINQRQQEHSVKVAYVQDIFDEFGYGLYDTSAIQAFLAYSYSSWQSPAPAYVLLVGEGSYDHRNLKAANGSGGNLMPVYLRSGIDPSLGEAAADNQYVDFNGDGLAEMMLGRLPAFNTSELTTMINKILDYESADFDLHWQSKHLFVSDNSYKPPVEDPDDPCTLDTAGDFFNNLNNFYADHFPSTTQSLLRAYYAPTRCYPRTGYPIYEAYYNATPEDVRQDILNNTNSGVQFITYVGHSGTTQWGDENYADEALVEQMNSGQKTSIVLHMTCLTGFYHDPQRESLSALLLKQANGAAVANYAPTGLQVQTGHDLLNSGFYDSIFEDGLHQLGMAVLGAKQNLFVSDPGGNFEDLQDTFMLLGDPAMDMQICDSCVKAFLPALRKP